MTDLERDDLLRSFFAECWEGLDAMEQALLALEQDPHDLEPIHAAFRAAHTLKGNALSLGFPRLAGLAHATEDRLERLRAGTEKVTAETVTSLLSEIDGLREAINEAAFSPEGDGQDADLPPASAATLPEEARTLRVNVRKLDRMLDFSAEVAVARGRLRGLVGREDLRLREAVEDLDRHCRELQEEILAVRAVPIAPLLRQQARTVRDAVAAHGKQARVVVEGDQVEVDTALVELLRDPLNQLVRNAVAHGIETPETRKARGKDGSGTIRLRARHEPGCVVLEVADDGNGFDRRRIAEQAHIRGLATDAFSLPDDDLFALVFESGFTTASAADDLSGRGVGMDVVKHNVERLRGSISIHSRPGEGATISLRLPLTLAILDAFFVEAAGGIWALPMESVVESVDAPGLGNGEVGMLPSRGEALPWIRLARHFQMSDQRSDREGMVIVQHGGSRAGLVIDRFLGEGQAVLKPLGAMLRGTRGVSGAALLGTGDVALILDVPALLSAAVEKAREQHRAAAVPQPPVTTEALR